MRVEKYTTKASSQHREYRFVSTGRFGNIIKVVQYTQIDDTNIYNLGFGDYDASTDSISDTVRSNNGDRDKVLATVAETVIDFLRQYPDATIFTKGSTDSRTRTYQIGIERFHDEITNDYEIFGLKEGNWEVFEPNITYEAFGMRKK